MRCRAVVCLWFMASLAGAAMAQEPARQGGDHPADAVPILSLPFTDTGNTTGMANDFAESCPYGNSGWAPDVYYLYEPAVTVTVDVDLCGSLYDTCLYVRNADTGLVVDCNDDYYLPDDPCGDYVSRLPAVVLAGGGRYWISVDGYPNSYGPYVLNIQEVPVATEHATWSKVKALYD